MNWLEFIATMTSALAWPIIVLATVILLRQSIIQLLPGLQRLRYKDFELHFVKQVTTAKKEMEAAPIRVPPHRTSRVPPHEASRVASEDDYWEQLAEVSPRAAILEAWLPFESLASRAAEMTGLMRRGRPLQMRELIDGLKDKSLLTEEEGRAVSRLRTIRNEVVHTPTVHLPRQEVVEYVSMLRSVTQALEGRMGSIARDGAE